MDSSNRWQGGGKIVMHKPVMVYHSRLAMAIEQRSYVSWGRMH